MRSLVGRGSAEDVQFCDELCLTMRSSGPLGDASMFTDTNSASGRLTKTLCVLVRNNDLKTSSL